jgi:hypothetical protein
MWHYSFDEQYNLYLRTKSNRFGRYSFVSTDGRNGTLIFTSNEGKKKILGKNINLTYADAISSKHTRFIYFRQ